MTDTESQEGGEVNNNDTKGEPWVQIQQRTFCNWMNDKLRTFDLEVQDLQTDLKDGVMLCKLMNSLKGKSIGRIKEKKQMNHYESSGNIALALQAMREDGVKLINIGAEDIASGNIKLILGMLWTLIRKYQIGSHSSLPPKRLMLSWVNAVLHPHRKMENFGRDWNDGIALFGIIEYCHPGSCPDWHKKSSRDRLANCAQAIHLANEQLGIPSVVDPQSFSSRELDELSCMTYLSYFMAVNSPGYNTTLSWVKGQITSTHVDNFDKDWNNGYILTELVRSLGAELPDPDQADWIATVQRAIAGSQSQLSVEPVISAKDMVSENVDYIGIMAYAAWHQHVNKSAPSTPRTPIIIERVPTPPPIPPPVIIERPPTPEPSPPPPPIDVIITPPSPLPTETPTPEVQEEPTPPPFTSVEIPAPVVKVITYNQQWRVHGSQTITVNTSQLELGQSTVHGRATYQDGSTLALQCQQVDEHLYQLIFRPNKIGFWMVHVLSEINHIEETDIQCSPVQVSVYDPSLVRVLRDETQDSIEVYSNYSFDVDCSMSNLSDVTAYVLFDGESMEHHVTPLDNNLFNVGFEAKHIGLYTVAIFSGGVEVSDSPFRLNVRDIEGIFAEGEGLTVGSAGHDSNFLVNFKERLGGFVKVSVLSPTGSELDCLVKNEETGVIRVHYTPLTPGEHTIEIYFNGVQIKGSPYKVNVEKKNVFIRDIVQPAYVGIQSSFILDASEAGKGRLEIDSRLPILKYDKVKERIYSCTFVPKKPGKYDLVAKYNGIMVEGCPCEIEVIEKPVENGVAEE